MSRVARMHKTITGIVIGRSYIPPAPRELGSEAERIQSALLHKPAPWPERLLDAFNENAMPLLVAICFSGFVYGLVKRFA